MSLKQRKQLYKWLQIRFLLGTTGGILLFLVMWGSYAGLEARLLGQMRSEIVHVVNNRGVAIDDEAALCSSSFLSHKFGQEYDTWRPNNCRPSQQPES